MSNFFFNGLMAASALSFSILGLSACSGGSSSPQPIQTAPATPFSTHLNQCYTAKLNGAARTVIREKVLVCRRDGNNQPVEHELIPRFQVGRTKQSKIGFRQIIAVKFSEEVKQPDPKADLKADLKSVTSERLALETSALEYLSKGCAPVLNAIFQRSGFESSHRFQVYREGDQAALSSEISKNGTVSEAFEFGDVKQAGTTFGKETPVVARPSEDEASKRLYHLLLEMQLTKEKGLRIVDEIADVPSGPLKGYVPGTPLTQFDPADLAQVARLQFCGQLAMRVAENYGLSEGRDCKSMSQPADQPADQPTGKTTEKTPGDSAPNPQQGKKSDEGLMKPGKAVSDLGKVKLAKREIHDILTPVCGTLKDQKGL